MQNQTNGRHVAVIMDGNGRWAKARFLPRAQGHVMGVKALKRLVEAAPSRGISVLTVFAFSSENWRRPQEEVSLLMKLFSQSLEAWAGPLKEGGVSLRIIGDKSAFSDSMRKAIDKAEEMTAGGRTLKLNIAANYGGRWDMAQAAKKAAESGREVTVESIEENLSLADCPDVDLMIRTGGEQRISNFLLWQSAYAEMYFTDALWPDFSEKDLDEALSWYEGRERRFGMTSEQVQAGFAEKGL